MFLQVGKFFSDTGLKVFCLRLIWQLFQILGMLSEGTTVVPFPSFPIC